MEKQIKFTQQWDFSIVHTVILYERNQYIGSYQLEETADYTKLATLYVNEEFRGLGTGKRLFEIAIKDMEERGYKIATLMVKKTNKIAMNMYKKYGFKYSSESECGLYEWLEYEIIKNK